MFEPFTAELLPSNPAFFFCFVGKYPFSETRTRIWGDRATSVVSRGRRAGAVAYLRVSTDKQADRGVSLEAQRAKVDAYATLYDLDVVDVIVDAGVTAKSLDRPGLRRALDMLRSRTADALLVAKLDRLTRSVRDLGDLVDRHFAFGKAAALLSVGEQIDTRSAAGRLVLNVLASVSQWEREAVGERTAIAMQHKASCGEYTGGQIPYGFRIDGDAPRRSGRRSAR